MIAVNLTPHRLMIELAGGSHLSIKPSGKVARVAQTMRHIGGNSIGGCIIPVPTVISEYGKVENLPAEQDGVGLIVSTMVRLALPSRMDLYSPADLVRDDRGNVVGCRALERNIG